MKIEDVIQVFNDIFIDIFEDEDIVLRAETTASDIDEWDSLNHIQLVVAIEKHFKIRFTAQEVRSFQNVGEMCQVVLEKISK